MNEAIILTIMFGVFGFWFGIAYPIAVISYEKLIKHSKKTIKEIMEDY